MFENGSTDHKLVQINASQRSSGTTSKFTIDFQTRDLDKVRRVTMIKASLPRLFTNIFNANNTIIINHVGSDNIIPIPNAQYNTTTLATALTTATGTLVTWTYNTTTNRFVATPILPSILLASSSIAPYIGLTSDITLVGTPIEMQAPPQLSGPDEVYVRSQLVSANSCVTAGSQSAIPLVGTIAFNEIPYGFVGRFDSASLEIAHIEYPFETCMRKIDVLLCDVYGNEINTPQNCFLDMILQFSY